MTRPRSNLIREENAKPGTRDWLLRKPCIETTGSRGRSRSIEGYCSHTSISAEETLEIFVSTPASRFTIAVYRCGFYGGCGARQMATIGPLPGRTQPDPQPEAKNCFECQWEASASLVIPADWLSGVYLGKLTAEGTGAQSYVIFVVRDDREADFLLKTSETTWQAYNRWPAWASLYDSPATPWYSGPDVQVSCNRPYAKYCSILESHRLPSFSEWHDAPLTVGSGEWLLWEYPFAYWMESLGYDVTYVTCEDVHRDGAGLLRGKGVLSIGHDEYYTREMFDNLQAAIAKGVSIGFFSGNTCSCRIAYDNDSAGRPHRRSQRVDFFSVRDPRMAIFSGVMDFPYRSPLDKTLIGAGNVYPLTGGGDWICVAPEHWLYAGTGMKRGDSIPGMIGWEWHGEPADLPGLEIVASGTTRTSNGDGGEGTYTATVYPGPRGNVVFNASSIWWGDGLAEVPGYVRPSVYTTPRGPNARVQRITMNVLERMRMRSS